MRIISKTLIVLEGQIWVKPQDLSAWYFQFLAIRQLRETAWSWARENWAWIKAALVEIRALIALLSFLHTYLRLNNVWQSTRSSLNHELSDLALSRNIGMGIGEIAAVDLINREKWK